MHPAIAAEDPNNKETVPAVEDAPKAFVDAWRTGVTRIRLFRSINSLALLSARLPRVMQ